MPDNTSPGKSPFPFSSAKAAALSPNQSNIDPLKATLGNKSNYPVVVIGAGLGGLCVAAYLSKLGVPVTLVEQHSIPGGYATSFTRGGFTFEVSLHHVTISNNTAAILKDLGILDTLRLIALPKQETPDSFTEALARQFPSERKGIEGFVQEIVGIAEEISELVQNTGKSGGMSPSTYPKLWGVKDKTLANLLADYVKAPKLKDFLASGWASYGLPPSKLSAFYFAVARGGSLRDGSSYIFPRSQALSNALAETVIRSGGKIFYRTSAKTIKLKNGAVEGVELEDGRILPAVAVASNASALTTIQKMLPAAAVPSDYRNKLEGSNPSISCFIVWLGLNQDVREILSKYRMSFTTGSSIEADYHTCLTGNIAQVPYGISVYDHLFEGYSKPGKSTVTLLCLCGYGPWRKFEADYRAGKKRAYSEEKKRLTDILIARAEKDAIPGLRSMIESKESATPLTNWRYTRNPEGAIYGFDQTVDNAFLNRLDCKTPVKGLYLASAWGNPGGGYGGALSSGAKAFRMIMEDLNATGTL